MRVVLNLRRAGRKGNGGSGASELGSCRSMPLIRYAGFSRVTDFSGVGKGKKSV